MSSENEMSQEETKVPDQFIELRRLADDIFGLVIFNLERGIALTRRGNTFGFLRDDIGEDMEFIQRLGKDLVENKHRLSIEARAYVTVVERYVAEAHQDVTEEELQDVGTHTFIEDHWHDYYSRALESAGNSLMLIAGKMVTAFESEGLSVKQVPLAPMVKNVDDIIREANKSGKGVSGKEIVEEFDRRLPEDSEDISPMDESRFRKDIVPRLKSLRGLKNKRDRGGYFYPEYFQTSA